MAQLEKFYKSERPLVFKYENTETLFHENKKGLKSTRD